MGKRCWDTGRGLITPAGSPRLRGSDVERPETPDDLRYITDDVSQRIRKDVSLTKATEASGNVQQFQPTVYNSDRF